MNIDFARVDFGKEEIEAVNNVMNGYWLASGKENEAFEKEFAEYVGSHHAVCVNSGSSANLLALACLDLPKGSKVITSACGFPATLSPILHCGLEPVLVDYDLNTHNIDIGQVFNKLHEDGVKAIIFAHTMGNPVNANLIYMLAEDLGIAVIEDCCEALGAIYIGRSVGTRGTLGTYSFYPSHHITALGSGGMIVTDDDKLALKLRSLRDWGKVADWDTYLGDHKTRYTNNNGMEYFKQYTYETVGYNMKLPEACAAFGRVQLSRAELFKCKRQQNHHALKSSLSDLSDIFIDIPIVGQPSPFGYILTFIDGNKFNRNHFSDYLEFHGIRTRPFFAGNITRHKPFGPYQEFPVADKLMKDSLFIGVHTKLTEKDIEYVSEKIHTYFKGI